MKTIAVIGCVFFLLFMVAPVMAEEPLKSADEDAVIEEEGGLIGENAQDFQIEPWVRCGRVRNIRFITNTLVRVSTASCFINTNLRVRIALGAISMEENINFQVFFTSATTYSAVSLVR